MSTSEYARRREESFMAVGAFGRVWCCGQRDTLVGWLVRSPVLVLCYALLHCMSERERYCSAMILCEFAFAYSPIRDYQLQMVREARGVCNT